MIEKISNEKNKKNIKRDKIFIILSNSFFKKQFK